MASGKPGAVDFVNVVRLGKEQTITFSGIDLLPEKNLTLHTLAVLTFVRTAFAILDKSEGSWADVILQLATRQTIEEPLTIGQRWRDRLHLDAFEDIFHIPMFERSFRQLTTKFGRPSARYFQEALQETLSIKSPVALVTVRPPVCMVCLKIFDSEGDVFVVFSPHPAPGHNGLGITFCKSIEITAQRLCNIMPILERGGTPGGNLNWQARLLSNCTSYIFVSRPSDDANGALEDSIVYSSLSLLTMQAARADLQRQKLTLVKRNQDLEKKVEGLQRRLQEEKNSDPRKYTEPRPAPRAVNKDATWSSNRGKDHHSSAQQDDSIDSDDSDDDPNLKLAFDLQRAFDDENRELTAEGLQRRLQEKDSNPRRYPELRPPPRAMNKEVTWPSNRGKEHNSAVQQDDSEDSDDSDNDIFAIPPDDDPNLELALDIQRSFDDENRQLTAQRDSLLKTAQRHYHCGICLDDFPEDDVVHIDTCEHEICRDCARGHVNAKISEHRFPVLCPVCTADPRNREPGTISGHLVQLLGVSEEQYETWVEMEMAQFSVLINCRKCNQSAFVDRADAIASDRMQCPVPRCGHVWCKKCQQTIENDAEHSCDGSKEFENLVQQKHWKYCPSCRTPIEKQFGCNHLSCIVPGCNTHFCYACGAIINKTAIPSEILAGKAAHFRTCRLH